MKEKEFMNRFLRGERLNHNIYGMVKPIGIPDRNVKVYLCDYLRDISVNINELSKIESTFKYTDIELEKSSSKTS